jgi:mannose/fructose/N-acetylgalactosamine-specific phosphotransferase system component IIC
MLHGNTKGFVDFPFFPQEYLLLALLGGLLAVDDRAGWQSLLAHPVFASLIIGATIGQLPAAMFTGVALELVWLSILPMRGTRRADTVVGSVVGIGTTCILLRETGDARVTLIVSSGVFFGLLTAQSMGYVNRGLNRFRELRLGNFELADTVSATARRLSFYHLFSVIFLGMTSFVLIMLCLPIAVFAAERLTAYANDTATSGAARWLALLPVFGAAAMVQNYWHRDHNRFLIMSAVIVLVVLWIR